MTETDGGREIGIGGIKERELWLLTALRDWCAGKGLRMFLCGGTLLGAVRHRGSDRNIKITTRDDLEMFKGYLKSREEGWLK